MCHPSVKCGMHVVEENILERIPLEGEELEEYEGGR